MQILDQAVLIMRAGKGTMAGVQAAALLEAIAATGDEAARVWQGYLDQPGAAGDKYSLVTWIGPERSNQLQQLDLKAGGLVKELCAGTGAAARFLVMDDSPIQMAFVGLKEGETGPQAAALRLAAQQDMNKHLRVLADQVRSAKPGAGKPPTAAAKKPVAQKQVKAKKKKLASKSVKKTATKKTAKKSAAKATKKVVKKAPQKK